MAKWVQRRACRVRGGGLGVALWGWMLAWGCSSNALPLVYESTDPLVGFNLVSWANRPASDWETAVQSLHDLGVRQVALVTYRFNEYNAGAFGPHIRTTSVNGYERPDDTALAAAIAKAKSLGMTVTLNPFVEVDAPGGIGSVWRGNIDFTNSTDLATWFGDYTTYLSEMAGLAQTHGVDRLMIGSELQKLSTKASAKSYWDTLIGNLRSQYSGKLSYAANWNWEYKNVKFNWASLDEIGIDAYFELATEAQAAGAGNPSVEALVDGWQGTLAELQSYAQAQGRPILFSEVGYTCYDKTTAHPWNWKTSNDLDYAEQLNAYQAILQATDQRKEWLREILFWHWDMPGASASTYSITADSEPARYVGQYVRPVSEAGVPSLLGLGLLGGGVLWFIRCRSRRG